MKKFIFLFFLKFGFLTAEDYFKINVKEKVSLKNFFDENDLNEIDNLKSYEIIESPIIFNNLNRSEVKSIFFEPNFSGFYTLKLNFDNLFYEMKFLALPSSGISINIFKNKILESYNRCLKDEKYISELLKLCRTFAFEYHDNLFMIENLSILLNMLYKNKNDNFQKNYCFYLDNFKISFKNSLNLSVKNYEIELSKLKYDISFGLLNKLKLSNSRYIHEKSIILNNFNEAESFSLMEKDFLFSPNKKNALSLGDYYFKKRKFYKSYVYYNFAEDLDKSLLSYFLISLKYNCSKFDLDIYRFRNYNNDEIENKILNLKEKKSKENSLKKIYSLANKSLKEKNLSLAKLYYERILKDVNLTCSIKVYAYYKLGKIFFFENKHSEALASFNKSLEFANTKNSCKIRYYLSLSHNNLGNYSQAIENFYYIINNYPFTKWEKKSKLHLYNIKRKFNT